MKISTLVISLQNEEKRKTSIKNSLNSKGIDFEFINAVDFRHKSTIEINSMQPDNLNSLDRQLTPGEIGCSLSHINCYKKIIDDQINLCLILEDDAIVDRLSYEKIYNISLINRTEVFDILILGYSKLHESDERAFYTYEPIKKITMTNDFSIGQPWQQWTCGTVGYLITNHAAKKIYSEFLNKKKPFGVADDWKFFADKFKFRILHCRPLMVFENYLHFKSSIEEDRAKISKPSKKKYSSLKKIRGYLRSFILFLKTKK